MQFRTKVSGHNREDAHTVLDFVVFVAGTRTCVETKQSDPRLLDEDEE